MKRTVIVLALLLCLAIPQTGISAEKKVFTLQYHTNAGPTYYMSRIDQVFWDRIKERTNGRVVVKPNWAQSLVKTAEELRALGTGGVDLGIIVPGYHASDVPLSCGPNNVFFKNNTMAEALYASWWALYEPEGSPVANEWLKIGVKPLYGHVLPTNVLWSKKKITKLEDLKGLRIRSWGPYAPQLINAVGGVMVDVKWGEIYDAMDKGVFDVIVSGYYGFASGFGEVTTNISQANIGVVAGPTVGINLKVWNSFPDDIKAIFEDVRHDMALVAMRISHEDGETALKKMKEKGMVFNEFPTQEWIKAAPDLWELWKEDMTKRGLGKEVNWALDRWKEALMLMRSPL